MAYVKENCHTLAMVRISKIEGNSRRCPASEINTKQVTNFVAKKFSVNKDGLEGNENSSVHNGT